MFEQEAREWNANNPNTGVSAFACRFTGKYSEAAEALRQVRNEIETGQATESQSGHQDELLEGRA